MSLSSFFHHRHLTGTSSRGKNQIHRYRVLTSLAQKNSEVPVFFCTNCQHLENYSWFFFSKTCCWKCHHEKCPDVGKCSLCNMYMCNCENQIPQDILLREQDDTSEMFLSSIDSTDNSNNTDNSNTRISDIQFTALNDPAFNMITIDENYVDSIIELYSDQEIMFFYMRNTCHILKCNICDQSICKVCVKNSPMILLMEEVITMSPNGDLVLKIFCDHCSEISSP